jgi:hypothetical protein
MPIPVINYSAQQPQGQELDLIGSLSRGLNLGFSPWEKMEGLKQSRLANQLGELKNKFAPQQMENEVQQGNLANALSQLQLQYQPRIYEQGLQRGDLGNQLSQLDLQYSPQERQVGLDINREKLRLLPMEYELDKQKLSHQQNRFGQSFQFAKFLGALPAANRAAAIADNPEAFSKMLSDLGNAANTSLENQRAAGQYALNLTPEQQESLINSGIASRPIEQGFSLSPESIDRQRMAAQIAANNALNTMKNRNQMEGTIQFEAFTGDPRFLEKAQSASQYAGAIRQGKGELQKIFQSNPQAQTDYESFKHHDMTAIKNRIKQLEGMGSTDAQRKELNDMYDATLDSLASNPKRFMTQLNNLTTTMRRVGESVETSYNKLGYPSQLPQEGFSENNQFLQNNRNSGQNKRLSWDISTGTLR